MNRFDVLFFRKYLSPNEAPLLVAHRHVLGILDDMIVVVLIFAALPAALYQLGSFQLPQLISPAMMMGYFSLVYAYLLYHLVDWYNDVWIFTEHGVYDLDWSLFNARVLFVDYANVYGVEVRRSGWIESLINRGTLHVRLSNDDQTFILEQASSPQEIAHFLQVHMRGAQPADHATHHSAASHEVAPSYETLMWVLGEVVREHLDRRGYMGEYQKQDYEQRLQKTLSDARTIDLRPKPQPSLRSHHDDDEHDHDADEHDDHDESPPSSHH